MIIRPQFVDYWGEPERAPHDQSNGDRVCLSVCVSVCLCVHRTFTFRIYACSNLTQMCNISLVQSACYSASADSTSTVHAYLQRESRLQQRRDLLNAESTEERQARLQQRRDRLNAESPEERQARLQQRRDRLNAESAEETARLQQRRDRLNVESPEERQARLQKRCDRFNAESAEETQARIQQRRDQLNAESAEERQAKDVIDSTLSHQKRDKPGYTKDVTGLTQC